MASNKISAEKIIEEIADKLIIYLKEGTVNTRPFLEKIDLQVNNMEELLRILFFAENS